MDLLEFNQFCEEYEITPFFLNNSESSHVFRRANDGGGGNDVADDDRSSLNKGEFKTAVHAIMKLLLHRFDKNGDGRVSREEAKVTLF
jgi:hypothetical protein